MNNIFHSEPNYQDIERKNRYGVRKLQASYLQNQYEKMQQAKDSEKMNLKMQKQRDMYLLNELNKNYLLDVSSNRKRKVEQMQSLASQYSEFIKQHQQKHKLDKIIEKNIEKSTLEAPTWIRDTFCERQTYKKNIQSYSRALEDHVKLQKIKKQMEKDQENHLKRKIDKEADEILQKQYKQLQYRHRQKSQFQKRQNSLLGAQNDTSPRISLVQPLETIFKKKEQNLYSQGLSIQYQKEQQKRYSQDKMALNNSNIYNPITNPIPFIYKNPNVLKMMSLN